MAIEPLGSIMSAQMKVTKTAEPKIATENMDVKSVQAENKVDNTTVTVEKAGQKGELFRDEQEQQAGNEQLRKAVDNLNKQLNNAEAIFGIHEETNRITIKLIDKETKEVIKELPPEKTLDMIAKAWEMAGILVDEKR